MFWLGLTPSETSCSVYRFGYMQNVLQIPNKYGCAASDLKQKIYFGRDLTERICCTCQLKETLIGVLDVVFLFWIKWLHTSTWKSFSKKGKWPVFSEGYWVKQKVTQILIHRELIKIKIIFDYRSYIWSKSYIWMKQIQYFGFRNANLVNTVDLFLRVFYSFLVSTFIHDYWIPYKTLSFTIKELTLKFK